VTTFEEKQLLIIQGLKSIAELLQESYRVLLYDTMEAYQRTILQLGSLTPTKAHTHAINNMGVAYSEIGEFEKGMACFSKSIEVDSKNSVAMVNRAEVYIKLGKLTEAGRDFSNAIRLDPQNPTLWRSRAYYYKNQGELQYALADFREALTIDPNFKETKRQISMIEQMLGK
jgi:tetratricopeptide (TPR) repeat protein